MNFFFFQVFRIYILGGMECTIVLYSITQVENVEIIWILTRTKEKIVCFVVQLSVELSGLDFFTKKISLCRGKLQHPRVEILVNDLILTLQGVHCRPVCYHLQHLLPAGLRHPPREACSTPIPEQLHDKRRIKPPRIIQEFSKNVVEYDRNVGVDPDE